ncbi:MAG: hypothetical protein WBG37_02385 [Desulfobacterales bacterium]
MKAITLRGINADLAAKLKSVAAAEGKSVNQLTIEIIKKSLGLSKRIEVLSGT